MGSCRHQLEKFHASDQLYCRGSMRDVIRIRSADDQSGPVTVWSGSQFDAGPECAVERLDG